MVQISLKTLKKSLVQWLIDTFLIQGQSFFVLSLPMLI
jgi:hypothetical protein